MSIWNSLHNHTTYSLLDGITQPSDMADKCVEFGYEACAVTDHGTIGGAIKFHNAMSRRDVKPILGCEFYICDQDSTFRQKSNRKLSHLVVLAKNAEGWKKLLKLISMSNDPSRFYHKPRLTISDFKDICLGKDLVVISGHPGSHLADSVMLDSNAYDAKDRSTAEQSFHPNSVKIAIDVLDEYRDIFGESNTYAEIQLIDQKTHVGNILADIVRDAATEKSVRCLATGDTHYLTRDDAEYQRIVLCGNLKTKIRVIEAKMRNNEPVALAGFFRNNCYHLHSPEEIQNLHKGFEDELQCALDIGNECEYYELIKPPRIPHFECPDGLSETDYLKKVCNVGWKERITGHIKEEDKDKYLKRVREEMNVVSEGNLAGYFLIVYDFIKNFRDKGSIIGIGRGSVGGSLIAYLMKITGIDPVLHGLLFSRFYSADRKGSLPDIDVDFSPEIREEVIQYLKDKYGKENVAQMVTFGKLSGRSALETVLSACSSCPFLMVKKITKSLPQESQISDRLEATGETSVIMWTLKYMPDAVRDFCYLDENEELQGEYSEEFSKAINLEGVLRQQGKHPAGVVVSDRPIVESCPWVRATKSDDLIAGFDMNDLGDIGCVKLDALAIDLLSKFEDV